MARPILDELHIHPKVRQSVATYFQETVQEVQTTVAHQRVVVVGMAGNPSVKNARKLLNEQHRDFRYIEYGSYFNQWRRRNSLKMWTGWPTFPMVFVDGVLVGGYRDLKALADSSELSRMLASSRT